jgi:hypothetical protein
MARGSSICITSRTTLPSLELSTASADSGRVKPRLTSTIIARDYNMHHPMWNSTKGPDEYAEDALGWLLDMNLVLASLLDVLAHERGGVIDLIFAKTDIIDQITMEEGVTDYLSDHLLQCWTVGDETSTELMHDSTRRNYAKIDWEKFEGYIKRAAQTLRERNRSTPRQMDKLTEELEFILQNAINNSAPVLRICPRTKRWWDEELTIAIREARATRYIARLNPHRSQNPESQIRD